MGLGGGRVVCRAKETYCLLFTGRLECRKNAFKVTKAVSTRLGYQQNLDRPISVRIEARTKVALGGA